EKIKQQESVGSFSSDIFAYDTENKVVIIENQLGRSDHDHLGKILTYAGFLTTDEPGCHLIWIAEKIKDEHRAALDWLNARTDSENNFFGLQISLKKAGDMLIPDLDVVCRPNDWSRTEKKKASGELSATQKLYVEFWKAFIAFLEKERENSPLLRHKSFVNRCSNGNKEPEAINFRGPFHFKMDIQIRKKRIFASLYIDGSERYNGHKIMDYIKENHESHLEKTLGQFGKIEYIHHRKKHNTASIMPEPRNCDVLEEQEWPSYFEWLAERAEAIDEILGPIVDEIIPKRKEFLYDNEEAEEEI
ncbi:MAG: DUF4268 domain-containing protein, partial [Alphaproteobacteria bacterium]|nr:DUF4268 domain-containing protein [Alphaproteobacteria bacterium]